MYKWLLFLSYRTDHGKSGKFDFGLSRTIVRGKLFLRHTHLVSLTSDHPVSVGNVVVNFLLSLTSLKQLHGFASNFVWMFPWWTPTKLSKIRMLPLFVMELWVILCNFWPILKKSIKLLTRNHSYLIWRVPREPSFEFVQIRSLWPLFTILINDLRKSHFRLLSHHCTALLQILCGSFLGGPLQNVFTLGYFPYLE